jgi:hypothetical protein
MLGITTGKRVQIGIDTFRSDRITNEVIKGKVIYPYGLGTGAWCPGAKELIK